MDDLELVKENLILKSPAKRLKYLRQKVVKKNQLEFCQDGILRSGTLKLVEAEKLKISPKIAQRIVHKLSLEGVICNEELFLNDKSECIISLDDSRNKIIGPSREKLEEIRKKISNLTPIHIDKDLCPSLAPNGATALARELKEEDLTSLNKTICLVHGTRIFVSFLTYEKDQILAEFNGKIEYYPKNIIHFCGVYALEILYFN